MWHEKEVMAILLMQLARGQLFALFLHTAGLVIPVAFIESFRMSIRMKWRNCNHELGHVPVEGERQ
jgi:hypothetical protein